MNFPGFIAFQEVTSPEVDKLLTESSTKNCELDSSPVWLIKSLRHVFVPILVLLINCSLLTCNVPTSHKRAIIRHRIKKPGLDLCDPSNYVLSQIFPSFPNLLSVQFTNNFQITLNQIHFYHSFNLVSVALASILLKQLFLKSIMT